MPVQIIPDAFSMNYCMDIIYDAIGGLSRTVEVPGLDMATIIARTTIPMYSKFFPVEEQIVVERADRVPGREGFYYISAQNPIMSINRVVGLMDTRSAMGITNGFNSGRSLATTDVVQSGYNDSSVSLQGNLINHVNLNNFSAASTLPITTKFHPPSMVEFFPKQNYDGTSIMAQTMHPVTLETIGWNMHDEFVKMAKCDYFIAMKAIFKKYEKIQSIYGDINLDMEDFNNAASEKKDIVAIWRSKSAFRANNKRWYIA